jgi:hypothetical protein
MDSGRIKVQQQSPAGGGSYFEFIFPGVLMISVMQATYTHFSTEIMIARRGDKYLELLMMVVVPFIPWMRWRAISLPVSLSPFLLALLFGTWADCGSVVVAWVQRRAGCLFAALGIIIYMETMEESPHAL